MDLYKRELRNQCGQPGGEMIRNKNDIKKMIFGWPYYGKELGHTIYLRMQIIWGHWAGKYHVWVNEWEKESREWFSFKCL
jgi:hypothetical protein